jgi:superfamily II DNA or RNA helicase
MTARPYQQPAIETLARTRRGVVVAPAGAGKTYIACAALDRVVSRRADKGKARVLWIAHTRDLLAQAEVTMSQFPSVRIMADVTYLCPQSYHAGEYDLVIVDECHRAACASFLPAIESAGARWGITATPDRPDDLAPLVFERIGPIVYEIPREAVISEGGICHGRVIWHTTGEAMRYDVEKQAEALFAAQWRRVPLWAKSERKAEEMRSRCVWMCVLEEWEKDQAIERTLNGILNQSIAEQRQTIVICRTVDFCSALAAKWPTYGTPLHAKLPKKRREQVIADLRARKYLVVFATSLADEGLDVPTLDQIVMLAPSRSSRLAEQRTGRVLRAVAGKDHGTIHDFSGEAHYMLAAQAKARAKVYQRLGYLTPARVSAF